MWRERGVSGTREIGVSGARESGEREVSRTRDGVSGVRERGEWVGRERQKGE